MHRRKGALKPLITSDKISQYGSAHAQHRGFLFRGKMLLLAAETLPLRRRIFIDLCENGAVHRLCRYNRRKINVTCFGNQN
jgi:hypothetical protein